MLRLISILFLFVGLSLASFAQINSRSGNPASPEDKNLLRKFPCGGISILNEYFDTNGIPGTWTSIDQDGLSPHPNATQLAPAKGWQSVKDFKNPGGSNRILASPSWYENDEGPSDDWLISPKINDLPANTCLSWYAYSQDRDFPESYEVRISTSTAEIDSFFVLEPLVVIDEEGDEFTYRNLNLSIYEGEDIYLAFRHTSNNKFILALDDIRLAQVENTDLAVLLLDPVVSPAGVDIFLSGAIINQGLTEIDLDSGELAISYSINNTDPKTYTLPRNVTIEPNDTVQFMHDSVWTPSFDAVYWLTVYFASVSNDGNLENDTLSKWQGIGTKTPLDKELPALAVQAYPNPMREELIIESQADRPLGNVTIRLMNLFGQVVLPVQQSSQLPYRLQTKHLAPGMYILQVQDELGKQYTRRLVRTD
ncbi:MAG: choice-of-anchor J domain-containing protein [Bacteroidota bacterium]